MATIPTVEHQCLFTSTMLYPSISGHKLWAIRSIALKSKPFYFLQWVCLHFCICTGNVANSVHGNFYCFCSACTVLSITFLLAEIIYAVIVTHLSMVFHFDSKLWQHWIGVLDTYTWLCCERSKLAFCRILSSLVNSWQSYWQSIPKVWVHISKKKVKTDTSTPFPSLPLATCPSRDLL